MNYHDTPGLPYIIHNDRRDLAALREINWWLSARLENLQYVSSGDTTVLHLAFEMFKRMIQILQHQAFRDSVVCPETTLWNCCQTNILSTINAIISKICERFCSWNSLEIKYSSKAVGNRKKFTEHCLYEVRNLFPWEILTKIVIQYLLNVEK